MSKLSHTPRFHGLLARSSAPVLAALLALSISGLWSQPTTAQPDMPPTMVETMTVQQSTARPSFQAVGSLKALHGIMLRPEISGRITELHFKSGQEVKRGDLLVQLNPIIYQAQLKTIETRLALSDKTAERYQRLLKTKVVSQEDYDKVMATMAQDKAALTEAKARLQQTQIVAPFTGKVGLRKVSVGDYVQAGTDLVSLESQDPMLVEFSVPEAQMAKINVGQKVVIKVDAFPDRVFDGVLTATEALVDSATRSLLVQARVDNPQRLLVPGAFASVYLDIGDASQHITIPQSAVLYQHGKALVYKMQNQKAVKTDVVLGKKYGSQVTVIEGLQAGDEIITAGQHKIMPGAPVMKLPANPSNS